MSMNKKEQAEHQALIDEIYLLKAWRLSDPVKRDLSPPNIYNELSRGWDFNAYSMRVEKACSSSCYHGSGWEKTSSQHSRSLFSTEALALAAMRYEIEREAIKKLASIDKSIARLGA